MDTEERDWEVNPADADHEGNVRCVVMPCCGFTYDAIHTAERGLYSCPLCEPKD